MVGRAPDDDGGGVPMFSNGCWDCAGIGMLSGGREDVARTCSATCCASVRSAVGITCVAGSRWNRNHAATVAVCYNQMTSRRCF